MDSWKCGIWIVFRDNRNGKEGQINIHKIENTSDIKVVLIIFSLILSILSYFDWRITLAIGVGGLVILALFVYPEAVLISLIFGTSFYRAVTFIEGGWTILGLMLVVCVIGFFAVWFRNDIIRFRIDWFQVSVFTIVIFGFISLLWSYDPELGLIRWATWVGTAVLPMEFAIIFFAKEKNRNLTRITNIIIILALIYVIFAGLAYAMWHKSMLSRFGPEGDPLAFARSMGLLLVILVWLVDKITFKMQLVVVSIIVPVIYFLILSATRAPFAVAILLSVLYLFAFSRINLLSKIILGAVIIFGTFYFIKESYLLLRLISIKHVSELSFSIRGIIWNTFIKNFDQIPPLYGLGMGGFKMLLPHTLKYIQHAHNNFAVAYSELGVTGLVLYIIIMFLVPIKALIKYFNGFKRRFFDINLLLLEFGIIIWAYRIIIALINDSFASGNFDWIGVGIMYSLLYYNENYKYETAK